MVGFGGVPVNCIVQWFGLVGDRGRVNGKLPSIWANEEAEGRRRDDASEWG